MLFKPPVRATWFNVANHECIQENDVSHRLEGVVDGEERISKSSSPSSSSGSCSEIGAYQYYAVDPMYIVPWFLQSPRLAPQSSYHLAFPSVSLAVQGEIGAHDSIIFSTPHFLALPLSRAARVFSNTNILGELGGR